MAIISSCVQTFVDLNEISIGDIPPISPSNNQLWFCTKDNGTFLNNMLYKYNLSAKKWDIVNDYTDEILEAIKNLNVTSRNLLSDTAVSKSLWCTGIINQCGAKYSLVKSVDYLKHLRNNKLTYAFDWEYIGDNPSGTFVVQTAGPQWTQISKTVTISADNYWGTCVDTVTFTSENPFIEIGIRADNVIGTIKITHPRLVFGEKDLGWSQAPEDLEEKFTTIFNRTDKGIYMEHSGEGTTGLIDVNNKAIKISAPSLFLEGYTTINEHFKVLSTGDIEGTNAKFNGTITSGGTISGTAISGGTLIGSTIQNAIDNPTFKVTPTGAMTASNATIKGTISGSIISGETFTSANNKFKVLGNGTLEATEANITGSISAGSTIIGSTVIGSTIQNAATNPTFIVSNTGNIKGATITGSSFQNSDTSPTFKVDVNGRVDASNMNITGGSLNVGSNFNVSNTGILTAKSANFTGSINAGSTITGSIIQNAISNPTFKIDANGNITGGSININNAFNVNSAGKLIATGAEISGKVTIGSGSTVPTSYLSGTISSSQLNKTITDDISTAKTNSSNAVSILDSNKVNWSTAYKQIESWAESTPTGTTEFDGNKIKTGTIFANKMAIGDFTNICQIDENRNPIIFSKILDSSTTEVVTLSNKKYFKFGHTTTAGYYGLILINEMQIIKSGDVFKFSCMGSTTSAEIRLVIRATYTDGTYTDLGSNIVTATSTDAPINTVLKITNDINGTKIVKGICCFIYNNNKIGLTYLRSISINRMSTGELIVDGSITSGMIHTDGLNANTIKTGTLDAARIAANSITANQVAIGDYTNYCTQPTNFIITSGINNGSSAYKISGATQMFLTSRMTHLKGGEQFLITGKVYGENTNTVQTNLNFQFIWRDANDNMITSTTAPIAVSPGTTVDVNLTLNIPARPQNATYGNIKILVGNAIETLTYYQPCIRLMYTGELIVDGSITGNHIQAGSITTKSLIVGDMTNLVKDPSFENDIYSNKNGWDILENSYHSGKKCLRATTGVGPYGTFELSDKVSVRAGEKLYVEWYQWRTDSCTNPFNINVVVYNNDGTVNTYDISGNITPSNTEVKGRWNKYSYVGNIAVDGYVVVVAKNRANSQNTGSMLFDDVLVKKMTTGELIVDGAVTADKIITGKLSAASGGSYFDLNNGSMMLGSTSSANYLQWTGSSLIVKADSISMKVGGSVATVTDVDSSIDKIQFGGRNLILKSNEPIESSSYLIKVYDLTEDLISGEEYTFVIKGSVVANQKFGIWMNQGSTNVGYATTKFSEGVYYVSFKAGTPNSEINKRTLSLYNYPSSSTASTVEWVALYKGNKPLDWTAAPEDIDQNISDAVKMETEDGEIVYVKDQVSDVTQDLDGITNKVSKIEVEFDDDGTVGQIKTQVSSLQQTADGFTMDFFKKIEDADANTKEILSHISFTADGIVLGQDTYPTKLIISKDKIKFVSEDGSELAYFSDNKLLIQNSEILDTLKIANYGFLPNAGGSLTIGTIK